jgi:beta-glucosidase
MMIRGIVFGTGMLAVAPFATSQVSDQAVHWGTQGSECPAAAAGDARPWLNPSHPPRCRARYALDQFRTTEEKLFWISPPRPANSPPAPSAAAVLVVPGATQVCAHATRGEPVFISPPKAAPLQAAAGSQAATPAASAAPLAPAAAGAPPRAAVLAPAPPRDLREVLALPPVGRGSDGPAGIRGADCVTAFNTPLSVAATFDAAAAYRYGDLMGKDFFDAGYNFQLGPAMDIARTWRFGRVTESFGEDPFLVAMVTGAQFRALAENHIVTQMKHYAVYGQEQGRVGDQPSGQQPAQNNVLSERALREIYLPGFESAVRVGGASRVMCSFPRINGVYACENSHLLGILKNEFGFDGTVGPDFPSAQRSIVQAFMAGLDSGTMVPNAGTFREQMSLADGVGIGVVPESRLDDIILRTLIPQFRVGVFEHPARRIAADVSTPERRAAVADLITQGSVLLKNSGVLPLDAKVRSIAVIGAQATERAQVVEQGSAIVNVQHLQPVLPALRTRAGRNVKVSFAQGTWGLEPLSAAPAQLFSSGGAPGVKAEFHANANLDFTKVPVAIRTQLTPDLAGTPDSMPLPPNQMWSVRITAQFTPRQSGVQKFSIHGAGTMRFYVDDVLMGRIERADFGDAIYANVPGVTGKPLSIRIDYTPRAALRPVATEMFGALGGTQVKFGYAPPDSLIADAARAAAKADVAVVFVGHKVGEGMDRTSLSLPNDQNALIEAVARANPRTVVVLNTGGAVAMPWLARVAAVLEMWLPGDAYGPAAAKLLFGDADPAGRLPVTFPADESQGPATQPHQYPGTVDGEGRLDTAWFDEGIFVGYRFWDQHGQQPLFPFGHGLSYARFQIGTPRIDRTAEGGARISVGVRNTSTRRGAEVLQAYVGFPDSAGAPPRQLKGVVKLWLDAGEEREAVLTLDAAAFRYWDDLRRGWATSAGDYTLSLGHSSRDILWQQTIRIGD